MNHESATIDIVRHFKPLDVSSYLRLHGWKQVDVEPNRFATWVKSNAERGDFEVLLPLATTFRDFPQRVHELLDTLKAEERRAAEEIVEDLTSPHADVVRARLAPDGSLDGTLPLDAGAGVFQQMRDLMLAAACSAWAPRPVFAKRKPDRAMQFVRDARIGQTRRGSYVVTVLSPVPPTLTNTNGHLFDDETEPFSRKSTRTLATALNATVQGVEAAAATGTLDALSRAVELGVSANLCDAILGINRSAGNEGIEFSFSWAASREAPVGLPVKLRLAADSMPYLEEVSRCFRQTAEIEDVEVLGLVQKLERLGTENTGKVTISGTVDGDRRTVHADLTGDDHSLAIRAYENRLPIACTGELVREGKSHRLKNPRGFRLLDESET